MKPSLIVFPYENKKVYYPFHSHKTMVATLFEKGSMRIIKLNKSRWSIKNSQRIVVGAMRAGYKVRKQYGSSIWNGRWYQCCIGEESRRENKRELKNF